MPRWGQPKKKKTNAKKKKKKEQRNQNPKKRTLLVSICIDLIVINLSTGISGRHMKQL